MDHDSNSPVTESHGLAILNKIDEAILCIGNADSQFDDLVSRHKGNFKDSSGKYNLNA